MAEDERKHIVAVRELGKAEDLYQDLSLEEARVSLKAALRSDPYLGRAWELLGLVEMGLGDLDASEACMEEARNRKGHHPDSAAFLSTVHADNWPKGADRTEQVARLAVLGQVFMAQGNQLAAATCFIAVERYTELDWKLCSLLGFLLRETGHPELSLAYYEKAISKDDAPPEVYLDMAVLLFGAGRFEDAERTLLSVKGSLKDVPQFWNNLGTVQESLGNLDEAFSSYEKAVSIDERYYPALYSVGRVLQKRGRMEEARPILQKALDIEAKVFDLKDMRKRGESDEGPLRVKEIFDASLQKKAKGQHRSGTG